MANPRPRASPLPAGAAQPLASRDVSEDAIWSRLKAAGFDDEAVKERDKAALIAYITKLETEIYDYQHHMGLLILEKKESDSKREHLKALSESAEFAYKREHAAQLSALAESKKLEQSLKRALAIEKECVANIEKALHDMRTELAETKLAYERKIAEAHSMKESALQKFDDAEKKLITAESLHAEANRRQSAALRKLEDIEAREDDLRRRIASFESECDSRENELGIQRQALLKNQNILNEEQERLSEERNMSIQREAYITERVKKLSCLERDLEEAKMDLEKQLKILKKEKYSLDQDATALAIREKGVVEKESLLDKRERDLLILQEKLACKEHDEIKKIIAEHQNLIGRKRNEFETEMEQQRISFEDEMEFRRKACDVRETHLDERETAVDKREQDLKLLLSILAQKEEDVAMQLSSLQDKEQNLTCTREQVEMEIQTLEKERENHLQLKLDLEKTKTSLDTEKEEFLFITTDERDKLRLLERKLKEEIDGFRDQKRDLVAETDRLKTEKEKIENEWEIIEERREELKKEAARIEEERKAMEQYLSNEHISIKLEKENLHNQFKSEFESLSREREEFMRDMNQQHLDWFGKIQREQEDFIRDINIQRNELENCISKRRDEVEIYLKEKEEAFEIEKVKELRYIQSQKEMIAKELEQTALEVQKLNIEKAEIETDRQQREQEWSEIKNSIEELNAQREKLQKQRELLHADREEIYQQTQHLKKLEVLNIEYENKSLSEMQSLNIPVKNITRMSNVHYNYGDKKLSAANGSPAIGLVPDHTPNGSSPTSNQSWIRKCAHLIFRNATEKDSDGKHGDNIVDKTLSANGLMMSANSRKRSSISVNDAQFCSDPSHKQQKRARQNGVDSKKYLSNCILNTEMEYLDDETEPTLCHQNFLHEDAIIDHSNQENEDAWELNGKLDKSSKSQTQNFNIGDQIQNSESLAAKGHMPEINENANDTHSKHKQLNGHDCNKDTDDDDVDDEAESCKSVKEKLWNFLVT